MQTAGKEVMALEKRFWQSMVDEDTDTALSLLDEPSMMVSAHGAMQFNHAAYRRMAEQGDMVVTSYELQDMKVGFPNEDTAVVTYRVKQAVAPRGQDAKDHGTVQEMADSSVWVHKDGHWVCAMHTETPVSGETH